MQEKAVAISDSAFYLITSALVAQLAVGTYCTLDSLTTKAVASSVAALRCRVTTWLSGVAARYLPDVTWRNLHEWPQPMNPSAHLYTYSPTNTLWVDK